jgi:hypothetical protein
MSRFGRKLLSNTYVSPTGLSASGIWSMSEIVQARQAAIWPATTASDVTYLVVAGGGGGGGTIPSYQADYSAPGGGGGGQVITGVVNASNPQTYTIVVGSGGAAPPLNSNQDYNWTSGGTGGTTSITGNTLGTIITATGGAGGGTAGPGKGGTSGSGFAGGTKGGISTFWAGGSGGGDAGIAVPLSYGHSGQGGPGTYVAEFAQFGNSGYFGAGGAGAMYGQWANHPDYMSYKGSGWTVGGGGSYGNVAGQAGVTIMRIPLWLLAGVTVTGNPQYATDATYAYYYWTIGGTIQF